MEEKNCVQKVFLRTCLCEIAEFYFSRICTGSEAIDWPQTFVVRPFTYTVKQEIGRGLNADPFLPSIRHFISHF